MDTSFFNPNSHDLLWQCPIFDLEWEICFNHLTCSDVKMVFRQDCFCPVNHGMGVLIGMIQATHPAQDQSQAAGADDSVH